MATYTADQDGKVPIRVEQGDTVLAFAITGTDGGSFAPGAEIEIADERLQSLIAQLGAPFGIGQEQAMAVEAKGRWSDRSQLDRIQPEHLDRFLEDLHTFCRERGFPITKGGVEVVERPGSNEPPTITAKMYILQPEPPRDGS